jgi:methylenetetrahydrofolate reductase (NADPH)
MLSFEVFPPKTSDKYESVKSAIVEIAKLSPDYMSVTYGAAGTTAGYTLAIASQLDKKYGVPSLSHITCVGSDKQTLNKKLKELCAAGIENILALRGDLPEGMMSVGTNQYKYASELVYAIKEQGNFCIGGACYPEGHPESHNSRDDVKHLKEKVDAGCEFLTTQMFFDNNILYNFLYRIREIGINVPVVAGIMPVTNAKQLDRIKALSGTQIPRNFIDIVDRFGDNPEKMKQAGIIYAASQVIDLWANGVNAVHIYTMNKPDVAAKIKESVSLLLK